MLVGVGQFVQGARAQPIDSRSPESGLLSSWIANNMHHTYSLQAENIQGVSKKRYFFDFRLIYVLEIGFYFYAF